MDDDDEYDAEAYDSFQPLHEAVVPPSPVAPPSPTRRGPPSPTHSSVNESIEIKTEPLIEESMERLSYVQGVLGVVIFDRDGGIIRTTMELADAARYATRGAALLERARASADALSEQLDTLAVRTKKFELLLSASPTGSFCILVVQNPYSETRKEPHSAKVLREKCEKLGIKIPRGADRQEVLEMLEMEMMRRGM